MEKFGKLTITGADVDLLRFVSALTCQSRWKRDTEFESQLVRQPITKNRFYFVTPPDSGLELARLHLYLHQVPPGLLSVTNISPIVKEELTEDEYNHILEAFYKDNIQDHAKAYGLVDTLTME